MLKTNPSIKTTIAGLLCACITAQGQELNLQHSECAFFGPQREAFLAGTKKNYRLSALTKSVAAALPRTEAAKAAPANQGLIDKSLFQAMSDAGVTPADPTNDFEFIRRVTLDLTGRIPTAVAVQTFVNDSSPNKRANYIDSLLASPQWIDKWTMYYGDLFKNSSFKTQVTLYQEGRNAFYKWIKASLAANKPYDQMAREIISASGTNTWDPTVGQSNWMVGGRVTGGPQQDTQDQITANVAETFLGLANLNCLLCHDGRTHLYQVNLWGKNTSRYQAWQLAAFVSHVPGFTAVRSDPANNNSPYWWTWQDNLKTDYVLGSTTGNRPARTIVGTEKTIAPMYIFNGDTPKSGENYRAALAREVTGDFQFARAAVNYTWKQFFGLGIVEPANQFDLARLDPNNPPTDPWPQDPSQPWPLQPSNPQLLTALAQSFIDSGYDIKALQRQIVNSNAYQLSARYNGTWNDQWETLFARKLVRRLWSEEVHDSIAQSSGVIPTYNVFLGLDPTTVTADTVPVNWAMQFPETDSRGLGTPVNAFLDVFLRGNRDDLQRKPDGSLAQALTLMNDSFVETRIRTSLSGSGSLINKLLASNPSDATLVSTLYINVLSRYPTQQEINTAVSGIQAAANRSQGAEDILWALYNKVDFIFNY